MERHSYALSHVPVHPGVGPRVQSLSAMVRDRCVSQPEPFPIHPEGKIVLQGSIQM